MDNFSNNHNFWQQRLRRERQAVKIHVKAYYPPQAYDEMLAPKVAPGPTAAEATQMFIDKLYRSESQPTMLQSPGAADGSPQLGSTSQALGGSRRARPPLGVASHGLGGTGTAAAAVRGGPRAQPKARGGPARGRSMPADAAAAAARAKGGSQGTQSGPMFYNNDQRLSTPSLRSCRSATTRFTNDTQLWREVEQAVQKEVAKVVGPLQEQLRSEQDQRQQMEAALRLISGPEAGGRPLPGPTEE